jgi:16S rRNA (cytosine967-C5)-methyltransferase
MAAPQPTPERQLAFEVLRGVSRNEKTLGDLLAEPRIERLDTRNRAFLHELVLGTLRHRGFIDHALGGVLERSLDRVEPPVLDALRLGAYQVLRLRVPQHAAVNETVSIVRTKSPRAAGLANAVLRRLAAEGPPQVPDAGADPLGWLTSEGSLPRWLAERWLGRLGPETAVARARAFLAPPPTTYRPHPHRDAERRIQAAGLRPLALPVPGAWEATAGAPTALAREGVLYLQDLGSQMAAHLADHGRRVLDACAAPGGKSMLLADLDPERTVVSLELAPRRLKTLHTLVGAWGAGNVRLVGGDARRPPFAAECFDTVLLDAPCSGLGTLGRNPDIRWRAAADDVARHAARQAELIAAAARCVRPGGRLVYSACTLEPEETEDVVRAFLDAHPGFGVEPLPDWAAPFTAGTSARVLPETHRGDGFFAALLGRR